MNTRFMSTRFRASFMFIAVLLLGGMIGSVATILAQRYYKSESSNALTTKRGFMSAIERTLKPTETQRSELIKLIQPRAIQIEEINRIYRSNMLSVLDSLQSDVHSILDLNQRERLKSEIQKLKDKSRDLNDQH